MNQEKIGKFIAECRKEKNLTQSELAEKLNISNKAISKWETGKGMPDSSIMLELCKCLDINVNELLSGEHLVENEYKEKVDENIVNIAKDSEKSKKQKNKVIIIFSCIFALIILYFVGTYIYKNAEINVEYDSRLIKCEITDESIICTFEGSSLMGLSSEEINTDDETLVFITGKMLLPNKIHSHFESWVTMAELNSGNSVPFSSSILLDRKTDIVDCKDKIKVYYTNVSFNKIRNASNDELEEIINESNLMAEN